MKMWRVIRDLIDFLLFRSSGDDYTTVPLPLYLREVSGETKRLPEIARVCSKCSTRYLPRPSHSPYPEDGKCFRCSTGMERPLPARLMVGNGDVRQFDVGRKLKGKR